MSQLTGVVPAGWRNRLSDARDLVSWQHDAVGLALVLLDSFALAVAAALFFELNAAGRQSPAPGLFLAVLFGAYLTTRLLTRTRWSARRVQVAGALMAAFVILLSLWNHSASGFAAWDPRWAGSFLRDIRDMFTPAGVGVGAALTPLFFGFAWWRGVVLSEGPNNAERVMRAFRFGVLAYVVNLVVAGALQQPSFATATVIPYATLGMLALALARQARTYDERGGAVRPGWLVMAAATVLGLVGTAALVSFLFGLELFGLLLAAAGYLYMVIAGLLYYVFLAAGYVAEWIILWLRERVVAEPNLPIVVPTPGPTPTPAPLPPPPAPPSPVAEAANWVLIVVALVAGFAALGFLVARARRAETAEPEDGDRENLGVSANLLNDLRGFFRSRGRRNRGAPPEPLSPVRQLYRRALQRAAAAGVRRSPPETPYDFAPKAVQALPAEAVDPLTDAYVRVRYGEEALSEAEIAALRRNLERK